MWPRGLAALALVTSISDCRDVPVPAADGTSPVVKLDVYGVLEYPGEDPLALNTCCTMRRNVALNDPLTVVASAEDRESGASSLEVVATVISDCVRRNPPPGGPASVRRSVDRVLASSGGAGGTSPPTRIANTSTRLFDLLEPPCPDVRRIVDEDADGRPISVVVDTQATVFCGARFFARGTNGVGGAASTATLLLIDGSPRSSAFPCAGVPF